MRASLLFVAAATLAAQEPTVSEIRLRTDPADARVRPFETVAIQVRVYGKSGESTVRLRKAGAALKLLQPDGGSLSKPFAWQGAEDETYYTEKGFGGLLAAFGQQQLFKDAVLYTAPEKPGKYEVEATLAGFTAKAAITVDAEAPQRIPAPNVKFEPERERPRYYDLARRWAPFIAQETWFQPKADYPTRFDYDGDWRGDNNWDSLPKGTAQAYVYYAVAETATHWFLIYNVFHPRDYSDQCIIGTCHENDNEGLILTIRRDGSEFGRLQVMETLAHNNVYSYVADKRVRGGFHNLDGPVFLHEGRPMIFIESGGHGIYSAGSPHSTWRISPGDFAGSTGITLLPGDTAGTPRHASDRNVPYELLPMRDHLWTRAVRTAPGATETFDSFYRYRPAGGRPGLPFEIGGAFLGRMHASNKAKPFWGWHDTRALKKGVLAVGQWALDPAYAVSRTLTFPADEPFALEYIYNPFLIVDGPAPGADNQVPR